MLEIGRAHKHVSSYSGFNRVQVTRFYNILKEEMSKHGFQAHQIYNLDESGVTVVQSPLLVTSWAIPVFSSSE